MTTTKSSKSIVAYDINAGLCVIIDRDEFGWVVTYTDKGSVTTHNFGGNRVGALKRFQKYRDGKGF